MLIQQDKAIQVKICGMREAGNIASVAALEPAYMGFIFYKNSKRYVGELPAQILHNIPLHIKKTGVFVDAPIDFITDKVEKYGLDAVQLHGAESAAYCYVLQQHFSKTGSSCKELIKAVGIGASFDFMSLQDYTDAVDYFLFDTKTNGHGGSGRSFDWTILDKYPYKKPYFLSGGIGSAHLAALKNRADNRLYAIDINSRFETEPGMKDVARIEEFLNAFNIKK